MQERESNKNCNVKERKSKIEKKRKTPYTVLIPLKSLKQKTKILNKKGTNILTMT